MFFFGITQFIMSLYVIMSVIFIVAGRIHCGATVRFDMFIILLPLLLSVLTKSWKN